MKICVFAENEVNFNRAVELAEKLHLPMGSSDCRYNLVVTADRLELRDCVATQTKPLYVDFLCGALMHRRRYGGGRGQLLARAVGIKPRAKLSVLDATAGFGRDAFMLATLGCRVKMVERSPVVATLLADGLRRARLSADVDDLELDFVVADAIEYLPKLNDRPDVIYLDPMFPTRTKSALVKKEMRILRDLVGNDIDAEQLLKLSLQIAKKRAVVKRPRLAPAIPGPKPNLLFKGKSSRFDVYFGSNLKRK